MNSQPSFLFTVDVDWIPGSESGLLALCDFCDANGLRATVFVAGRFAERYPRVVAQVARRGHQLGTHGWEHGQLPARDDEDFRTAPRARQQQWLENATHAVQDAAGISPRAFRAPNLRIGETTLQLLEALEYECDSSVPARRLAVSSGRVARSSYFRAPLAPYHPSSHDLGVPGESKILEVPPSAFLVPVNMSVLRTLGSSILRWTIRRVAARSPVLVFYAHPSEFIAAGDQRIPADNPARYRRGVGPRHFAPLGGLSRFVRGLGYGSLTLADLCHASRRRYV